MMESPKKELESQVDELSLNSNAEGKDDISFESISKRECNNTSEEFGNSITESDSDKDTKDVEGGTEDEEVVESIDITPDGSREVMKQILKKGVGNESPGVGDTVIIDASGWVLNKENMTELDSSRGHEKLEFTLGRGAVLPAWDLGISGMKKGEVALFIVQPKYGYGDFGKPPTIPPHTPLLFEIELHDWKLEDLTIKRDGSILRKILNSGKIAEFPNEGSRVKVSLIGTYETRIFEECEKEFILGEGVNASIVEGVEIALYKMAAGERSYIYLKSKHAFDKGSEKFNIPSDASVVYEVTLISFEKAKDVWEMNTDQKLEVAQTAKEKGVTFLKEQKYKAALRQFRIVLTCLDKEPGADPDTKEIRANLLLSSYLNVALCLLKIENYMDAIRFCDKAIQMDPKNEKAIFRRGQARLNINVCEEALDDFKKISALYPENKAAKQLAVVCEEKIKEQTEKDKSVYNNMFIKFMQQDAERMKNMKTETGVWEEEEETEEQKEYLTETERLIKENDSLLRDANIIELSNTAL